MDKLIPVVVIKDVNETEKTLSALRAGGVNCAEITFRTACAAEAISLGVRLFPDMNIGAGTVINGQQCVEALNAGAKFIVSPGLSEEVAGICAANGVLFLVPLKPWEPAVDQAIVLPLSSETVTIVLLNEQ